MSEDGRGAEGTKLFQVTPLQFSTDPQQHGNGKRSSRAETAGITAPERDPAKRKTTTKPKPCNSSCHSTAPACSRPRPARFPRPSGARSPQPLSRGAAAAAAPARPGAAALRRPGGGAWQPCPGRRPPGRAQQHGRHVPAPGSAGPSPGTEEPGSGRSPNRSIRRQRRPGRFLSHRRRPAPPGLPISPRGQSAAAAGPEVSARPGGGGAEAEGIHCPAPGDPCQSRWREAAARRLLHQSEGGAVRPISPFASRLTPRG